MNSRNRSCGLLIKNLKLFAVTFIALFVSLTAVASETNSKVFITLTSAEQQTRGMAMVLANTMQAQGAEVEVLLCDSAGDMALKDYTSEPLKPRDVTPEQLMGKLMSNGAAVRVCALYLPNKGASATDLKEGITAAKPPAMAASLLAPDTLVFNF